MTTTVQGSLTVRRIKNGNDGAQGLKGCITRVYENGLVLNQEYRNDDADNTSSQDGSRYADFVAWQVDKDIVSSGYVVYQTLHTFISNIDLPNYNEQTVEGITDSQGRKALKKLDINAATAFFNFILTRKIKADEIDVDNLIVKNVNAVSSDGATTTSINGQTGKLTSVDADISGKITSNEGRLGNIEIRENKLIGNLPDGKSVEISINKVPNLSSLFENREIPNTSYSNQVYSVLYREEDRITGQVIYNYVYKMSTNNFYLPEDGILSISEQSSIIIESGTITGNQNIDIELYNDKNQKVVWSNNATIKEGTYYFVFNFTVFSDLDFKAGCKVVSVGCSYKTAINRTSLSSNGIFSVFSGTNYFYLEEQYGMQIVKGNIGFRVTQEGVQKLQNGVWSNI